MLTNTQQVVQKQLSDLSLRDWKQRLKKSRKNKEEYHSLLFDFLSSRKHQYRHFHISKEECSRCFQDGNMNAFLFIESQKEVNPNFYDRFRSYLEKKIREIQDTRLWRTKFSPDSRERLLQFLDSLPQSFSEYDV